MIFSNITKLYKRKVSAERTEKKRAQRKQARIEWQYATDDCDAKTVNGILDATFQEDEIDEALNVSICPRTINTELTRGWEFRP